MPHIRTKGDVEKYKVEPFTIKEFMSLFRDGMACKVKFFFKRQDILFCVKWSIWIVRALEKGNLSDYGLGHGQRRLPGGLELILEGCMAELKD